MTKFEKYQNVIARLEEARRTAPNEDMRKIWEDKIQSVKAFIGGLTVKDAASEVR